MNNKHLACVLVVLAIIMMAQGIFQVRKRLVAMQREADSAKAASFNATNALNADLNVLNQLKTQSRDLTQYLALWEPFLSSANTPESGELSLSLMIKQAGLTALSQRFEVVTNKDSVNIPKSVRAHLSLEDDYAKSLNWLGEVEQKIPTARTTNLRIVRGESASDIRMDVAIDIPLATAPPTAPASPAP